MVLEEGLTPLLHTLIKKLVLSTSLPLEFY